MKRPAMLQPDLVQRVNLIWYPLTLIPILVVGYLALTAVLPPMILLAAFFLLVFWVFSLLFALYNLWARRRKRP